MQWLTSCPRSDLAEAAANACNAAIDGMSALAAAALDDIFSICLMAPVPIHVNGEHQKIQLYCNNDFTKCINR